MQSVIVAHLADTHLGYRQYSIYERELDIYEAFSEAISKIIEERVDIVVHAGDFFDTSKPPPQAIRVAIRELRRLREAGIPIVAVLGDHDIPKRRGEHPLSVLEEVGLVKVLGVSNDAMISLRVRNGSEVLVAGLPHHRKTAVDKLRLRLASLANPDFNGPKILVLHQGLEGYSPEPEIAVDELPRGYSYYALGHIHRPSTLRVGETIGAYPGSLDALRLDEAEYEHGFVIAEVDSRSAYTYQVKLDNLRPQPLYLIDYESLEEELRRIASTLSGYQKKPLLHLVIRGRKIDRQRVYRLVQMLLGDKTLYTHLLIDEIVDETSGVRVEPDARLDRFELLVKLLGDRELAKLADDIIEKVAAGARDYEIRLVVEEFFKKRYGGGTQ
ncbi:metallophosphoesterase [Pyrolobus fumarii 1A]|uniref:DNA double-strand break repair protein Mre11 n=1 Tax=Pyrolobus fumarii (strain DSM 11204 / 1A) TaxID=694429 RepID=G0EHQ5_PYRF1|nr:exonuclease SbcCD subunit D [Pyrolobus fumarii]AEM39408.1 metallophosphoesterase [Pyrolobus fumarii 1A]